MRTVSTAVTAGAPGSFDNDTPATTAELNSLNIGTGAAWAAGQYVQVSNGADSYWDGQQFVPGKAPAAAADPSTSVTAGAPGAFDKDVPGDLEALRDLGIGTGPAWAPGQHVLLGSGFSAYWDGAAFQPGKAPAAAPSPSTSVTAGAPGAFDNDVPATIGALVALGIGSGPLWEVGDYVQLGDGSLVYWDGAAFIPGKSPVGFPVPVLLTAPAINGVVDGTAEVTGTFGYIQGVWYGAPSAPVFDGWYFTAPGGSPVSVGTTPSYTTLGSQLGGTLMVRETVTESGPPPTVFPGQSAPVVVNYQAIAITNPGTVTGTGIAGQVLTHSDPTVNYPQGATIVRHWQADGVDIPGLPANLSDLHADGRGHRQIHRGPRRGDQPPPELGCPAHQHGRGHRRPEPVRPYPQRGRHTRHGVRRRERRPDHPDGAVFRQGQADRDVLHHGDACRTSSHGRDSRGVLPGSAPVSLSARNALAVGSGPAWAAGEYVVLTGGSEAYWDGTISRPDAPQGPRRSGRFRAFDPGAGAS